MTHPPLNQQHGLLLEDLEQLVSTIVAHPERALRFFLMVGLVTSLPRHHEGQIEVESAAVLMGADELVVDVYPGRFDRGDGTFIVVDGSQQLPRLELLWLIDEIAGLPGEAERGAALLHVVITTLADSDWVCW